MPISVSMILLLILFVGMLILIAKDVMERAALVLICAVIAFFILIFIEGAPATVVVDFMFGTAEDGYVNFRTLALIFGIIIISTTCHRNGLFQFIAFKMIQLTKGEPKKMLIVVGGLTFCVSAVLADSITAIILIPLTITVCRTVKVDPTPYIIIQAIFIKLGATVLPISSVPSILITSSQNISFGEYFVTSGLISVAIGVLTLVVFYFIFGKALPPMKLEGLSIFLEYNAWVFVKDKRMMITAASVFVAVIACLIIIPPEVLKPDAIAITGAAIILAINRGSSKEIIRDIDFDLLLYLLGIFVITGSLQYVGFIDLIGGGLTSLGIEDVGLAFLALLWIGALASAFIDNIPITQILLSLINLLMGEKGSPAAKMGSLGLALGVIWGDNFTPFGDSILALNVAKANGVEIKPMHFMKIGASLTFFQLSVVSIVILLIYDFIVGLLLLLIALGMFGLIFLLKKRKSQKAPN